MNTNEAVGVVNTCRGKDTHGQLYDSLWTCRSLTLVHPPAQQSAHSSPGLEVHNGMFSFFHVLKGFLQPTRQIQTLTLADLKVELPLIKNLVLVIPFQCNWHAREAM